MDISGKWVYNRTINLFREDPTMKRKLLSAVLAAAMMVSTSQLFIAEVPSRASDTIPIDQLMIDVPYACPCVYQNIIAMEAEYPSGTPWSDNTWIGNSSGCVAFAKLLANAAFGDLSSTSYGYLDTTNIRVGDRIRVDGHTFMVLEVAATGVYAAEGNVDSEVLWGDFFDFGYLLTADFGYHITNYPEEFAFRHTEVTIGIDEEAPANVISRDAVDLTWTSSDPDVAVVDGDGNIIGVNAGEAVITATSGTHTETVTITVTEGTADISTLGNINADTVVDSVDAAAILTASAATGAGSECGFTDDQKSDADVNKDGFFDAEDAALILQYAAAVGSGYSQSLTAFLSDK